ncbi:formate--tetrahydrofolate ligase [Acidipila sp. EB88]|uniref:formate--tetrahydrofolate ligase n=1 Tax=Acidipila sp. EB88 TaxID=2305226 RepID=UPI000F5FD91D|nr:formate--tetrahydrofolate ligase [Acidipila sp. EB88]RRA48385.1 formate--tetrahydrofolate ligase [Acidipila sp. EB88]
MKPQLLPIAEVAAKLGVPEQYFEQVGRYGGKVKLGLLDDPAFPRKGKLILVTATTPTVSGEGKTVTSIGLTQGLEHVLQGTGKRVVLTSREPSLGPVFGMKGGAAGGGLSQVEPSEKINLHFHGDFHAITSAHNLLAALLDAHIFHGNDLGIDPATVTWPRALDMNDRGLRRITTNVAGPKKDGSAPREGSNQNSGFVITAASEIMAILALATDRENLRERISAIIVAETKTGEPVRARDLDAVGPMMALLAEAIEPNLVQTTSGTPAFVHAGPFANIAHGTSSIVSQEIALRLADYAVNECGFASDLGLEKYMDIVTRISGIAPSAAVLVTTAQSLKNQGQAMPEEQGKDELERGFTNLAKHVSILRGFGLPVVVGINHFPKDTDEELARLKGWCDQNGLPNAFTEAFTRGAEGAADLARAVLAATDGDAPKLTPTYSLDSTLEEKIEAVAMRVYGAEGVDYSDTAKAALARFEKWGFGKVPVCIAKTQYSLSDDPKLAGAPTGWRLKINNAVLSAGAGFVVLIAGNMMLMPGLPKASRAMGIDVDAQGEIVGLR